MKRGDIFFVSLPNIFKSLNSVERGRRPVVVVSSDIGCRTAPIVMVAPITTKLKWLTCNVNIDWTCSWKRCQVLCNQLMTVPKSELEDVNYAGSLANDELDKVDEAILISLGIAKKYCNKGDN